MRLHSSEITGSLSIKGSITPDGSGSHDLGSANNPWKDIHVMSSSIHVYDATGPIAKLGARSKDQKRFRQKPPEKKLFGIFIRHRISIHH